VVNVSLPYIAGSLSATVDEATWALTAYLAANAVILPMTGWLAQFFGRKRLLTYAVAGFTLASIICGLSVSMPMLVVFRILQGFTGGVMQPLSQAVMLEAFPPQARGKAMGFWGLGIVVAPMLGPVLGGWLTANYSWRWVFYINVPVGIAALILQELFIFDPPYVHRTSARIDWWGIGLLGLGVGALQIALDKGQEEDWLSSRFITWLLVIAVVGLVAMVIRELTTAEPVVDLRVFRERTYATGVLLMSIMGFVLYGSLVLLPILLQTLMGYPPLEAGITLAPRGFGSFVAMPVVGLLTSRVDPRKLLTAGFGLTALTMFWFSRMTLDAGYWDLFWPQFVQGLSLGLMFVPLTTITMDAISKQAMGNATSLFNLTRNIGGSIGIATVQTLVARHQQVHTAILGAHVSQFEPSARRIFEGLRELFISQGADATAAAAKATAALWGMVERQAAILSFLDAFRTLGWMVVVVVPLVLLMRRPRHEPGESVVVAD
ncbi:MAG: DHA2 family efflux MFS transporter permease subunit, partial [Acidobacteria bacterium]|nr:DHA2 family efflux MFS transporter permease subunit [Acidobacteriota bacterium]